MAKGRNLPLKILGIILGTLLGLVLLVLVAFQVFFHTSALKNTVLKVLSSQVEGTVSIGDVRLSLLKQFPDVTVSVKDLLVTYPHERFAPLAPEGDEGRGAEVDTLLSAAHLYAGADARAFLKEKRLLIHKLDLDQALIFARRYDTAVANWQILKFLQPKDTVKESSFELGDIHLTELSVTRPRVLYSDLPGRFRAKLVWDKLLAQGSFIPGADTASVDATLSVKDLELGDLLSTLGVSLSPALVALSTDGRLSLDAAAAGPIRLDSLSALPPVQLRLDLPKSHVSWKGLFDGAELRLSAQGENTGDNVRNVTLDDFLFHLDGLDLSGAGGAKDLMGKDPLFNLDAKGSANLKKVIRYLPKSFRSAFAASGHVDLDLNGSIRQSQLSLYKCSGADLKGKLVGDVIRFEDRKDTISCYLQHPVINLGTMDSAVDAKDRAIAATATADSLDFDLGSALCARGRNILIFAQNASKAINDSSMWHPLVGKATADRLVVRAADSLVVGTWTTSNKFTVTPLVQDGGWAVPYLRLDSDNSRMFFKNSAALLAAKDASISATAQMKSRAKAPRDSTRRRRRFQTDSTGVPDFLREKDFRRSDISFQVNQSLRRLSDNWNPSLHLRSSEGLFASPAFPLRSRFNGLSASLKEDKVTIDSVRITSGTSDLTLKGTVEGLKRGLTHGRSLIRVNADLASDRLNLNEIIAAFDKGKTEERPALAEESEPVQVDALAYERQVAVDSLTVEEVPEKIGLFVVPANVIGDVHLNVAQLDYSTTLLQDFQADASMQQRCIRLDGARATTDMGRFELDAFYSTKTKQDLALGFGLKLRDVTAEKVIEFFPKIDEVVPMLKSFKGILDCEMAATTQIDTNMNFLLPTLDGMFKIHGQQLVLEDLGSLKKIAKTLMFKDQMTGRIDEMTVNGVISDNTLEVFPFILAIDRYVVALQGVQRLNKSFDYHVSLIKSPILLKLGVNIFGPSFDAWKFRLGKPKYRSTKVPLFNEEVDNMQLNLVSSIKNVFTKGVDRVLQESREAQAAIAEHKKEVAYSTETEIMTAEEQNELERLMMEQELEEETAALNEEIDKIIEGML